jgi:hypothetical protein
MWATLLRCPHIHRRVRALRHEGVHRTQTGAGDNLPDWQARRRPKPPSSGSTPCPTPCRARMPGHYSKHCRGRLCASGPAPAKAPARLFVCARCRAQVLICSCCDRGQIYCAGGCAQAARYRAQRAAGQRYQTSRRGRLTHAVRARRWRARQKNVTHQGSPPRPADDVVAADAAACASRPATASPCGATRSRGHGRGLWRCHWCGCLCPPRVRIAFLRR